MEDQVKWQICTFVNLLSHRFLYSTRAKWHWLIQYDFAIQTRRRKLSWASRTFAWRWSTNLHRSCSEESSLFLRKTHQSFRQVWEEQENLQPSVFFWTELRENGANISQHKSLLCGIHRPRKSIVKVAESNAKSYLPSPCRRSRMLITLWKKRTFSKNSSTANWPQIWSILKASSTRTMDTHSTKFCSTAMRIPFSSLNYFFSLVCCF